MKPAGRPAVQRAVAGLVIALLTLAGCGNASVRVGADDPPHSLTCEPTVGPIGGMVVAMAQSVPTASVVPCVDRLPTDWGIAEFDVRNGRTRFVLHYMPLSGETLTVELTAGCDPAGAPEMSSDQPGMRRFDRADNLGPAYADKRFYLYPEACTTVAFHLTGTGRHARAAEIADAFGFVGRADIDRSVREYTHGRLRLDPEPAR